MSLMFLFLLPFQHRSHILHWFLVPIRLTLKNSGCCFDLFIKKNWIATLGFLEKSMFAKSSLHKWPRSQLTLQPNYRRCQLDIFKGSHVATGAHFIFHIKEPWRGLEPAIFGEKYAFMCAGLKGLGRWTAPTEEIFLFGWCGSSLKHLKHLKLWDSEMARARTCLQHFCSARVHTRFRQSSSYTWDLKFGLENEVGTAC
jgi:hypothetical protein